MPAVKTPPPRISAPDSSGRGPGHKLPTGGGGEGEFSNRPPEHRDPRERLSRARIGLAILLTTSFGLFVSLSLFYLLFRRQTVFDARTFSYVSVWHPIAIPPLLWWNTGLLILSSIALEFARRAYFREDLMMDEWLGISRPTLARAVPWEAASFLLASGFVAGQLYAWSQLRAQGVFLGTGPSSQFYYFLTGLHGVHLLGGMIVLIWTIIAAVLRSSLETRRIAVDITAWYWHAITVVWFGVFALLKLCQ